MIGPFISHYRIFEEMARGGMGVVCKAEDLNLKRPVALKFLAESLASNVQARERFVREAQAASALDHPNICTVYEIGETPDGQTFIAMPCYEGETLQECIERGPLPISQVFDLSLQIARGLSDAHRHGITHLDVKPANIYLTTAGLAKILDFGLARIPGGNNESPTGTTMGTARYMSPEQARGENADHRSDIWSFGVLLYEMIAGCAPFPGEQEATVIYRLLNEEPKPLSSFRADVPGELEQTVRKAMEKERTNRYQCIDDMICALTAIRENLDHLAGEGALGIIPQWRHAS